MLATHYQESKTHIFKIFFTPNINQYDTKFIPLSERSDGNNCFSIKTITFTVG